MSTMKYLESTEEEESTGNRMGLVYWKISSGGLKPNGKTEYIMEESFGNLKITGHNIYYATMAKDKENIFVRIEMGKNSNISIETENIMANFIDILKMEI